MRQIILSWLYLRASWMGRVDDATAEAEDKVKGGLLLDVVVREGAAVLELLAREDETLLVRGDACERRGRASSLSRRVHLMSGTDFARWADGKTLGARARGTTPRHDESAAARAQDVLPSTLPTAERR